MKKTALYHITGRPKAGKKSRPWKVEALVIEKYLSFENQTVPAGEVLDFYEEIRELLTEKKIFKLSPYLNDIEEILTRLWDAYYSGGSDLTFTFSDPTRRADLLTLARWNGREPGEVILERFLKLHGCKKAHIELKGLALSLYYSLTYQRIKAPYQRFAKEVTALLIQAAESSTGTLKVPDQLASEIGRVLGWKPTPYCEVPGLSGVEAPAGEPVPAADSPGKISGWHGQSMKQPRNIAEIETDEIERQDFGDYFNQMFHRPYPACNVLVWGNDKAGKSTFCAEFAVTLSNRGKSVLWIEGEELIKGTFRERFFQFTDDPARIEGYDNPLDPAIDWNRYDWVILNSVGAYEFTPDTLKDWTLSIRKANPSVCILLIYHATKDGRYRGTTWHGHFANVLIKIWYDESDHSRRFQTRSHYGGVTSGPLHNIHEVYHLNP